MTAIPPTELDYAVPSHLASLVGRLCVCNDPLFIKTRSGDDMPGFVSDDDYLAWAAVEVGVKFLVVDAAVKYDIDEHAPLMWLKIVVTGNTSDVLCGWVYVGAVTTPDNGRTPKIQVTPVDT